MADEYDQSLIGRVFAKRMRFIPRREYPSVLLGDYSTKGLYMTCCFQMNDLPRRLNSLCLRA